MRISTYPIVAVAILAALSLSGCPRDQAPTAQAPADTPEPAAATPPESAAPEDAPPPMIRKATVLSLAVVEIEADRGEDGEGNTVEAANPVAIEITAEAWPVRALDPVLHVGDLIFSHYTFPRLNVLRYVVADREILPAGAEAFVQYGADPDSRVTVAESLEVRP